MEYKYAEETSIVVTSFKSKEDTFLNKVYLQTLGSHLCMFSLEFIGNIVVQKCLQSEDTCPKMVTLVVSGGKYLILGLLLPVSPTYPLSSLEENEMSITGLRGMEERESKFWCPFKHAGSPMILPVKCY